MLLHCGLRGDGSERLMMSTDELRDTSSAWKYAVVTIPENGMVIHFWFYGKQDEQWALRMVSDTIRAIKNNTFGEWFKWH
jgi:hypothetical protein